MSNFVRSSLAAILFSLTAATAASAEEGPGVIKDGAVMGARVGMTLESIRKASPDANWIYEHDFMVDFSALCAVQGGEEDGETLFCAIVPENHKEDAAAKVAAIAVFSDQLATPEGAYAGMTVADAVKIFGEAKLSYNLENEAREYLVFEKAPKWLSFQATSDSDPEGYAGVYAKKTDEAVSQETTKFAEDAVIDLLWIN